MNDEETNEREAEIQLLKQELKAARDSGRTVHIAYKFERGRNSDLLPDSQISFHYHGRVVSSFGGRFVFLDMKGKRYVLRVQDIISMDYKQHDPYEEYYGRDE